MTSPAPSILIVGIGNEYRRDDGAGLLAARQLAARLGDRPDISVLEKDGDGAALMDTWSGVANVILIDAACSGSRPGTLHCLNANEQTFPSSFFSYSSHAFSVAEAVELARTLDQLPARLVIYGIEGKNFESGLGLSPDVEQAVELVVSKVEQQARSISNRA